MQFLEKFKEALGENFTELQNEVKKALNENSEKIAKEKSENLSTIEKQNEILNTIAEKFGVEKNGEMALNIEAILSGKNTANDIKIKGLEKELKELKTAILTEKTAKLEALKKASLKTLIDDVENLNKDHREIVEIKLNNALKINENGEVYFNAVGDTNDYLKAFFAENEKYLLPNGSAGSGNNNGFNAGKINKKFSEMSLAERAILFKENESLYYKMRDEARKWILI